MPRRIAYACAAASGLLYWLAFPGVDVWPLAFVAWVPLILALVGQPPRRALLLGGLAGLTMNVAGFSWLQGMLETFSGFPAPICFLFVLVVCAYQGGRIALLGWLYARACERKWPRAAVFAAAFATSELAYPLLFPWYYSATVHQLPVLTQVAEIGGPILVGLALVGANLALAEMLIAPIERRPIATRGLAVAGCVLALSCTYGAARIHAVDRSTERAPAAKVGVVQADMGLMEKRTQFGEGLRRHLDLSADLRARGAEFLVWSETSAMHPVRDETYRQELRSVAHSVGLPAIFGAVIVKRVPDEREYVLFNSAVSSDPAGLISGRYDKQYLLTFGEYLPFGEKLPVLYRWSPNSGHFTPGTSLDPLLVDVGGKQHRVTTLICYEDILPGFTNDAVRHASPDLLVNMTNDAWFGDTSEPWEHLALAQLRAVEHRRYLVRGTNSGVSAIVDPVGRVTMQTGTFRQATLLGTVHWLEGRTVYEAIGDWPWVVVSLLTAGAAFRRRPASVPPRPAISAALRS
jgi:apolipoprotein N-acyltransferase